MTGVGIDPNVCTPYGQENDTALRGASQKHCPVSAGCCDTVTVGKSQIIHTECLTVSAGESWKVASVMKGRRRKHKSLTQRQALYSVSSSSISPYRQSYRQSWGMSTIGAVLTSLDSALCDTAACGCKMVIRMIQAFPQTGAETMQVRCMQSVL